MKAVYRPSRPQQEALADHLVKAVIADATGVSDEDRCVGEPPSARYYLAALAPHDVNLAAGTVKRGRVVPNAAGFEFEIDGDRCVLTLEARCSVYYRVLPTY